jgi:hypothetical protein
VHTSYDQSCPLQSIVDTYGPIPHKAPPLVQTARTSRLRILDYQSPNSRLTSSPEARIRPERHNPHSIATLRIILARSLLRQLCQCPFCGVHRL